VGWAFAIVLVLVAGAVAAFGIYTWGWRDEDVSGDRARAMLYADQVARLCNRDGGGGCSVSRLGRVAKGLWRFEEIDPETGQTYCIGIDLEHFRVASNGETLHGVSGVSCSKE
jgi:hypothetical protein